MTDYENRNHEIEVEVHGVKVLCQVEGEYTKEDELTGEPYGMVMSVKPTEGDWKAHEVIMELKDDVLDDLTSDFRGLCMKEDEDRESHFGEDPNEEANRIFIDEEVRAINRRFE